MTTEKSPLQKSLVEQIFDEMFASIEEQKKLDNQTIQRLRHLATIGELKKPAEVINVIKSNP